MDSVAWTSMMRQHVDLMVQSINRLAIDKVSMKEAGVIAAALPSSAFDESARAQILATVNSRACDSCKSSAGGEAQSRSCLKPQEHLFIHRYMTDSDWKSLLNDALTVEAKISTVVHRCHRIRLFSCTEKTSVGIASLVLIANGKHIETEGSFRVLQMVKDNFKRLRASRGSMTPSLQTFPPVADEFVKAFPDAFDGEPPVPPRIDESVFFSLRESMPARRSHASLKPKVFAPLPAAQANCQLVAALQQLAPLFTGGQRMPTLTINPQVVHTPQKLARSVSMASLSPEMISPRMELLPLPAPEGDAYGSPVRVLAPNDSASDGTPPAEQKEEADAASIVNDIAQKVGQALEKKRANAVKGKATAKSKVVACCTAGGKAAAKAKAKAATPKAAAAPPKTAGQSGKRGGKVAGIGRPPALPRNEQHAPIRFGVCSIYSAPNDLKWRVVADSNRRYDRGFSWKRGRTEAWNAVLQYCSEQV